MSEAPENPSEFESSERFWGSFEQASRGREGPRRSSGSGNGSSFRDREDPPPPPTHEQGRECLEWCPICRTAEVLRGTTPDEVRDQFAHIQHDALVAMRAMLNSYIERLEQAERRGGARPVEDIPIE
jgi:hypothetical protein